MVIAHPLTAGQDAHCQFRARQIFEEHIRQLHVRIDRMFVVLMGVQWAFAVLIVLWLSPFTWNGAERQIHPHLWLATLLGGLLTAPAALVGILFPGRQTTRYVIALCQVGFSSLLIHVTGGRIETHFHVFGSLAFLAAYRDWKVLVPATICVALDHLVRGIFWPETVFGVATPSHWRWLEHAGWVLFEDLWLIICCSQVIREMRDTARHSAELEQSHVALEKQTTALEEALREREAIVEGALDAVVQMDSRGHIIGWNSQASRVFGWSAAEVIGRPLAETIGAGCPQATQRAGLSSYLAGGVEKILNRRIEVETARRDGTLIPIELAITPTQSNGQTSYCAFVRDISDRRQAERRLKLAKEAAESANQSKSLFLANMSHEIRTPLNAILGFTDLLRSSDDELSAAERNAHLEAVHRGGTHLLAIINDILDLSKIEAGQMHYERVRFSPHQVIVDTLSFMRVRAAEKGISLEARWLGRVPETILSDPARFRQLLLNLVGNAIKFTERGGVQILSRVNASKELLQVEIIDTGVGIPADKIDSLFTPFTQADVSVTRRFGGTGLGLSICRHIVSALGGEITVESSEGHGSTLTFTIATGLLADVRLLETPPQEALTSAPAANQGTQPKLTGMRVLIVDDGETNRQLLHLLLKRAGAVVETAEHGQEAVERTSVHAFDAILMDMQMPVLDGYSATRQLRERGITTPVIALTAHAMSGEEQKCRAAGCDFYLTKPVNRDELMNALSRLRAVQPVGRREESTSKSSFAAGDLTGDLSDKALTSELDLSDAEVRDIVNLFVERLAPDLERISAAWEDRDWEALDRQAHLLKGTAAMTGFAALSEAASRVEELALRQDETQIMSALTAIENLIHRIGQPTDEYAAAETVL